MLNMTLGEKRCINIKISSLNNAEFDINNAEYTVYLSKNGELTQKANGQCKIDGHSISHEIEPDAAALYLVKYELLICDETVIKKEYVNVTK